ncbi:DUF6249 domain-containing protein [Arenimonas sp.]|uniref:DUF6249 domain-containing protein n=1 Tax=Arenimonas sp. TaxID=1872635 RepID=UPI0039E332F9
MPFEYLIPISLFVCITLAIKFVIDGRVRRRYAETNVSEDLIKAMLVADEQSRRLSALKWGIVLTSIGAGFGLVGGFNMNTDNPAVFGLLIASAGIGMLIYHFVSNKPR